MREKPFSSLGVGPAAVAGTGRLMAVLAAVMPLAGCGGTDRLVPSSIATDDPRIRHPIALAEDVSSVDVFPSRERGGLDRHTAKQVATFGEEYRQAGRGPILLLFPRGAGLGDQKDTISAIKAVLAQAGARARLQVATYPITDPALASPIRLSFTGLKAKVIGQCGEWPSDIGSASTIQGWENRQYYNFGCATQSMLAAQTADPRDLVTPRGEEPADTQIRSRAIESVRAGRDPATTWSVQGTTIAKVGGS